MNGEAAVKIETVTAEAAPMLYLSRSVDFRPQAIADVMAAAWSVMRAFLAKRRVRPCGPPVVRYHDWNIATGKITFDLGYPVAASAVAKASGEVRAGRTPAGKALKAVHRGPYMTIPETYRAMAAHMEAAHIAMPSTSWEVYVSDPDTTPQADLLTEVYMPVP